MIYPHQGAVDRIQELAARDEKVRTTTATLNFEGHKTKVNGSWTAARVRTVLKSQARIEAIRPQAEAAIQALRPEAVVAVGNQVWQFSGASLKDGALVLLANSAGEDLGRCS